jgi:hypothetical protein
MQQKSILVLLGNSLQEMVFDNISTSLLRFSVLMAVTIKITIFRDVMLCSLVANCKNCRETCYSYQQGKMFAAASSETLVPIHQNTQCLIPEDIILVSLFAEKILRDLTRWQKTPGQFCCKSICKCITPHMRG